MDELMSEGSRLEVLERISQSKDSEIKGLQSELAKASASLSQLESDLKSHRAQKQEGDSELKSQLEVARSKCTALEGQVSLLKGSFDAEREASAIALESLRSKLVSEAEKQAKATEATYQV